MTKILELDIASFIPAEKRSLVTDCKLTIPENVVDKVRFSLINAPGPRRGYNVEILSDQLKGRLNFLLGPGKGDVKIASAGHLNVSFRLWRKCNISIGEGTTITSARVVCDNSEIHIGKDGLWSDEILVQSNDQHGIIDLETLKPINAGMRKIHIGDHVWIGRRTMIMPDAKMASGSLLAAGAVLTGEAEENCIYAGVPARKIRDGVTWSRAPQGLSESERKFIEDAE